MKILALEPFYSGSHRQFLDGWIERSIHEWTVLGLSGHKWKWRMRHAPITFAEDVRARFAKGERWDAVFCSDMLHLGEFLALAPVELRLLPTTVYFHENQFTYPTRSNDDRDMHFAFTNYVTALVADQVWFNSKFHQEDFLSAATLFLRRMPDNRQLSNVESIRRKASVQYPGVEELPTRKIAPGRPFTILWSSRWEFDKDPATLFAALAILKTKGVNFKINVLGESFGEMPQVFEQARKALSDNILNWGFVEDRHHYLKIVAESDVIVSTALHEFFGIAVVEALGAGVPALLPDRLAYPELLEEIPSGAAPFLYDGSAEHLAEKLASLAEKPSGESNPEWFARFRWSNRVAEMDVKIAAGLPSRVPKDH